MEATSWEFVEDLLQRKLEVILDETESDQYKLFITNTEWLNDSLNHRDRFHSEALPYVPNFRIAAAQEAGEREYKGNRAQPKPLHYFNLMAYLANHPNAVVARDGLEADDVMAMEQTSHLEEGNTVICSHDKDLKQVPGWQYSWEVGKRPSFGPLFVDPLGTLQKEVKRDKTGKVKDTKVTGTGDKFLYYQMLVGDIVDNIQGIPGLGPVGGYDLIHKANTTRECYEAVAKEYQKRFPDVWKERLSATANLVYLIRGRNKDGSLRGWRPPKRDE